MKLLLQNKNGTKLGEIGSIVYLAVMGFGVLFMFLAYFNNMAVRNRSEVEHKIKLDGEALNISEAGLFETLAQFKKNGNMLQKRNPKRDGAGVIELDADGKTVYLDSENYVDFNFIWTCRNVVVGCPKLLEVPFHYEIAYDDLYVDRSVEVCEICTAAGRDQKGFFIPTSEEPKIGIVRNFDLNGKTAEYDPTVSGIVNKIGELKVRYEVWERMVEDFSRETGADATDSGRVWIAKSVGIVYKVMKVNGVKEIQTLATVSQSRMYKKPSIFFLQKSALHNTNVNGFVSLNANAQVINNGDVLTVTSSYFGKQTNLGAAHAGANIIDFRNGGTPENDTKELTFESVFGLSANELREFADVYISDVSDPRTYEPMLNSEIKYIEGDVDYTTADPLFGNGLLIVSGNITITGTGHKFEGVLWVTRDITITAGGYIKGTIVAGTAASTKAEIFLKGRNASDWFRVYYDQDAIDAINNAKFKYAMFRVPYVTKGSKSIILTQEEKDLRTELILAKYPAD